MCKCIYLLERKKITSLFAEYEALKKITFINYALMFPYIFFLLSYFSVTGFATYVNILYSIHQRLTYLR